MLDAEFSFLISLWNQDPAKISDDELRPWVTNHEQDAQVSLIQDVF